MAPKADKYEWLRQQFINDWCAKCGRDHRHHTALQVRGDWAARCDLEPVLKEGKLVFNPEAYPNELMVKFKSLPLRVQENMLFEARGMGKSVEELMRQEVHKIWLKLADDE